MTGLDVLRFTGWKALLLYLIPKVEIGLIGIGEAIPEIGFGTIKFYG